MVEPITPTHRAVAALKRTATARRLPLHAGQTLVALCWLLLAAALLVPVASFLIVAISPRLFQQGTSWFTVSAFRTVLTGYSLHAMLDTLLVGVGAAVVAVACAVGLAWLTERTTLVGRSIWRIMLWALLLAPSYLEALGWSWLVGQGGVLERLTGTDPAVLRTVILGPIGVIWVLATRGVPFAYLSISALLRSTGREYEEAARTHGLGRLQTLPVVLAILAPGLWSGFAIVFAESISDYGVAATMATQAHFPLATAAMYEALGTFPAQFPIASAVGWLLLLLVGLALLAQRRSMRGRTYAVLSGRTRPPQRTHLRPGQQALTLAAVAGFFVVSLGVPVLGSVLASFLRETGPIGLSAFTLANYRNVLHTQTLLGPLLYSARQSLIVACAAVLFGAVAGRALARRAQRALSQLLDLLLLAAIALPSLLLACGYIFTYNLPIASDLGLDLYGTTTLLVLGYLAGALPSAARLLSGSLGQVHDGLIAAARVHGAPAARAWSGAVLPLVAGPLVWTWLVAFSGTMLELPISQILSPPGDVPLSVAITKHLEGYDFGGGGAMTVLAVLSALVVIGVTLTLARWFVPGVGGWGGVR